MVASRYKSESVIVYHFLMLLQNRLYSGYSFNASWPYHPQTSPLLI